MEESRLMKRNVFSIVALMLCVAAAALMRSDGTAAAPADKFTADTGVAKLGANQKLRITVNGGSGNDQIRTRFIAMQYHDPVVCNPNDICSMTMGATQISTAVMPPNQALMTERTSPTGAVRVVIET